MEQQNTLQQAIQIFKPYLESAVLNAENNFDVIPQLARFSIVSVSPKNFVLKRLV